MPRIKMFRYRKYAGTDKVCVGMDHAAGSFPRFDPLDASKREIDSGSCLLVHP